MFSNLKSNAGHQIIARVLKILFKINVKIFVVIILCNVLLYLPDYVLLYLVLIRPVFWIGVIIKPN